MKRSKDPKIARWMTTGRLAWPSASMYSSCEALGQHGQVELDGGDLPVPAERVLDVDVDLRAVEGAVALFDLVGQAVGLERLVQRIARPQSHCSSVPR